MADVYFTWTRKKAKCNWCSEHITAGQPMVKVKHWRAGRWSYYQRFHTNCYIEQGMDYLEKNPLVTRRMDLSDTDRKIRTKLIGRYSRLKKRLVVSDNTEESLMEMTTIREAIKDFGGVPKKWLSDNLISEGADNG